MEPKSGLERANAGEVPFLAKILKGEESLEDAACPKPVPPAGGVLSASVPNPPVDRVEAPDPNTGTVVPEPKVEAAAGVPKIDGLGAGAGGVPKVVAVDPNTGAPAVEEGVPEVVVVDPNTGATVAEGVEGEPSLLGAPNRGVAAAPKVDDPKLKLPVPNVGGAIVPLPKAPTVELPPTAALFTISGVVASGSAVSSGGSSDVSSIGCSGRTVGADPGLVNACWSFSC